ncbi:nucleotide exchange factor GrpE [Halobacterium yunchengense]|uniref:nucleotide exchange factor GrpE n=1 Tax=Halobacterium yunchengense TaxID=3108497 RepID=UPI00300BF6C8
MSNDAEQTADADERADAESTAGEAETAEQSTTADAPGDAEPLAERVRDHDEALGDEVAALEERVAELEGELADAREEVADLTERLQAKQADFQNYKQRAKQRQEDIKARATEDLVERLLDVRDNLDRALDEDAGDVDSLREGVKLTRKEFDRVLDAEGVSEISPEPGAEVDAQRHEVMMRVDSDQPEGTVAAVYRSGYEMGGKVLRAAQVTVSEGNGDGER